MKPYYYVYRVGNRAPTVRHATPALAAAEAERLAAIDRKEVPSE